MLWRFPDFWSAPQTKPHFMEKGLDDDDDDDDKSDDYDSYSMHNHISHASLVISLSFYWHDVV